MFVNLLRYIYVSYAILVFVVVMVALLPFIVLPFFFGEIAGGKIGFFFLRMWGWCFSTAIGVTYKYIDRDKINSKNAYIFTCNHRSFLDSVAMVLSIRGQFRPLGKIEMSKVPIFGFIYKYVVVMVDRSNPESRRKSLVALKHKLQQNISVFIFPEGRMNQTENLLTSFYDGAFRLAIETQTPIVPMIMLNTAELLPRRSILFLRPGTITTVYADPIPTTGLTIEDTTSLKLQVYEQMYALLEKYKVKPVAEMDLAAASRELVKA